MKVKKDRRAISTLIEQRNYDEAATFAEQNPELAREANIDWHFRSLIEVGDVENARKLMQINPDLAKDSSFDQTERQGSSLKRQGLGIDHHSQYKYCSLFSNPNIPATTILEMKQLLESAHGLKS